MLARASRVSLWVMVPSQSRNQVTGRSIAEGEDMLNLTIGEVDTKCGLMRKRGRLVVKIRKHNVREER